MIEVEIDLSAEAQHGWTELERLVVHDTSGNFRDIYYRRVHPRDRDSEDGERR